MQRCHFRSVLCDGSKASASERLLLAHLRHLATGALHDTDFMVKDSKRFADSGGWGWAAFEYDSASDAFRPAGENDSPPQEHDAKCGFACHTIVADKDYVFTAYPKR